MLLKSTLALLLGATLAPAANWTTFGGDPERTGWAREETTITRDNVKNLKLLWSKKLNNTVRELTGLTAPVVLGNLYTQRGLIDIVVVGGSSDTLFALDGDTGEPVWSKQFHTEKTSTQKPNWLCPNALNDTPVIDPATKTAYVIAADGMLYAFQVVNGEQVRTPQQFVPAYSKNWSLNLVNGMLYTPISQMCSGAQSGVYTLNVKAKDAKPSFFQASTAGAGIWGRGGVAVDSSTEIAYAASGDGPVDPAKGKYSDAVMAVSATGKLLDYYIPPNSEWITRRDLDMGNCTPVVFPYQGRKLVATGGKEGVVVMMDAASLGGADHRTPLYQTPLLTNDQVQFQGQGIWGALASAEDSDGNRWLYAPIWGPCRRRRRISHRATATRRTAASWRSSWKAARSRPWRRPGSRETSTCPNRRWSRTVFCSCSQRARTSCKWTRRARFTKRRNARPRKGTPYFTRLTLTRARNCSRAAMRSKIGRISADSPLIMGTCT